MYHRADGIWTISHGLLVMVSAALLCVTRGEGGFGPVVLYCWFMHILWKEMFYLWNDAYVALYKGFLFCIVLLAEVLAFRMAALLRRLGAKAQECQV